MVFFVWLVFAAPAAALDEAAVMQLGDEDGEAKLEAINKLIAAGDIAAIPIIKAMQEERCSVSTDGLSSSPTAKPRSSDRRSSQRAGGQVGSVDRQ